MSALGSLTVDSGFDDVAGALIGETRRRSYTRDESVACLATAIQESGLRPKAVSPNGKWVGIYQQDTSYLRRGDPNENIREFLNRLDVKRRNAGASPDIWKNIFWLQQRPGEKTAELAYTNGRKAYLTEIKGRATQAAQLYDRYATGAVVPDNRPDFNEFPLWSPSNQSRDGTKVDLFLLHTQEGGGGDSAAENLAKYLGNPANQVSYHYTVGQASDGGVTVVDVVDTDLASWSVLSANNRSINLCFAGSRAAWTRDQWMKQSSAIDVAAYLAVQDCKKYGIAIKVLAPPYNSDPPGISDHKYVTQWLKDGTHTDVGPNFPWDYFSAAVAKYATADEQAPAKPAPVGPADDQLTLRWNMLGGQTVVEALAEVRDKLLGTNDRDKTGAL